MIILYLIIFIVALILANIFIVILKPKKRQKFTEEEAQYVAQPEIVGALATIDEKHSLMQGSVNATQQKLSIINDRLTSMERAVADLIERQINAQETQSLTAGSNSNNVNAEDYEKLEFRLKVLEDSFDNMKNPKPVQKTFYGKVDPEMEREIKSLVFNTKRTVQKN